ncbi:hypothetical protein [Paracoccus zeaxanthinifaciens]|uniref:hypothetical protein n=1 Tax=Paracoccus zeaxanthinifaciens TaxID=187400 RepID=UPI0003B56413|nr:hypothetical protein [Paracoccus zeaxanthinifaciens]
MTALTEFQRLEAQGSWRATNAKDARDVIVSLGEATLTLMEPSTDRPLTHWSLPAVTRLNPGRLPASYTPSSVDRDETVEIDDPLMIEAIERVQRAIANHRSRPGRLRGALLLIMAIIGIGVAGAMWLPDALIRHAARIAPPAQAQAVGMAVLHDLSRSGGAVCRRKTGQQVLDWLAPRLLGENAQIFVIPGPLNGARRLPGDIYVMGEDMLLASNGPEAAAGHLLAAQQAQDPEPVTLDALRHAGLLTSLRMMTIGTVPEGSVPGYGAEILAEPLPRPDFDGLPQVFAAKGVPTTPYARSIDPTGASVMSLIQNDPAPARSILTDEQWLALQQICAG